MRVFAAMTLPEDVRDHLASALAMVTWPTARNPWAPSLNWHVTLGFFGEQPEGMIDQIVDQLDAATAQTSRFQIGLAGAGVFHHDVCWVGVSDPTSALGPLAQLVRQTYATAYQHAQNRFHVTVSRAGRQARLADAMAAMSVYRGPVWEVQQVVLYRSDLGAGVGGHPLYTELARSTLSRS
ncbi:MAG: RNA 2',3'-cyclic phosphodiesterase [Propionibacteriaceae bacterium]|nr:RNA 2',3'-cyclic phosphodiesterase [Propionibacteriaceae bacterium]